VLLGNSDYDPDREQSLLDAYVDGHVDGIVLLPTVDKVDLDRFRMSDIPLVLFDRGPMGDWPGVLSDHRGGAYLATRHLIAHGYQNIAAVTGPHELSPAKKRLQGWRDALTEAGLNPGPVISAQLTREAGYLAGRQLLSLPDPIRAVFLASDVQAFGFLRAATEAGVRIPDDLAVLGFDGTSWIDYVTPPLSTVVQPVAALAKEVISLLDADSQPNQTIELGCSLEIRDSCGHHSSANEPIKEGPTTGQ
jgi:LacI family transcriptional regulator